jgi:hypothetical protein
MCELLDIGCHVSEGAKGAFDAVMNGFVGSIGEAFSNAMASVGTLWINMTTLDLTKVGKGTQVTGAAPGTEELATLLGYVAWIGFAVAVFSLIALGALMALKARAGEGLLAVGKAGTILGGVVLISGSSSLISGIMYKRPSGIEGTTQFLQSSLWWYTAAAAIASVIIGAIRMIWEQRAQPGKEVVKSILTLIVISGAGLGSVSLFLTIGDQFSTWIIEQSMGCDISGCLGKNLASLIVLTNGGATMLMLVLGLFALLASLMQMLIMIARGGMLVVLAGVLPLSASFSNTEMGKSWLNKNISWLVALIAYKPAAAIIYATAFQLAASKPFGSDGVIPIITGLCLMILALVAMPALMKFITPMVGALAGGAGGAAAVLSAGGGAAASFVAMKSLPTGAGPGSDSGSPPSSPGSAGNEGPSGNDGGGANTTTSTGSTSPDSSSSGTSASQGSADSGSSGAAAGSGSSQIGAAGAGGGAAGAGAAAGAAGAATGVGAVAAAVNQGIQAAQGAVESAAESATGEGNDPSGSN